MKDVYEECPAYQGKRYLLRLLSQEDLEDLLQVYSDKNALPFFNADNCDDNFFYETKERMQQAMDFWFYAYENKGFVRLSIVDQQNQKVIGTIELFPRNGKGFLRLDVRSDYETKEQIGEILSIMIPAAYEMFECDGILTKGAPYAIERVRALQNAGFVEFPEGIVGNDGTHFGGYWCIEK